MDRILSLFPSKKFVATTGASLLVIGLVVSAYHWAPLLNKKPAEVISQQNAQLAISKTALAEAANKDSDNDSLKDWEEILWHTDSHSADTDHDGTPDGVEVEEEGRDPTRPGPNDKLAKNLTLGVSASTSDSKPLTTTDMMARDVFSKYVLAKQSGQPLDDTMVAEIVGSTLSQPGIYKQAKVFVSSDVRTSTKTDAESLRQYGNAIGSAIKNHPSPARENELVIAKKAFVDEFSTNKTELAKLDGIISSYQGTVSELSTIVVPASAVGIHLSIMNAMQRILEDIQNVRNLREDPLPALMSLNSYIEHVRSLANTLTEASRFFNTQGVSFGSNEPAQSFLGFVK